MSARPDRVPSDASDVHAAVNNSGQDLVLYAFFLGVENGPVLPAEPPADCDPF